LLGALPGLQEAFHGRAAFALVYIAEAHASDEWPVGLSISHARAPRTLPERMELARQLVVRTQRQCPSWNVPVLVDGMEDLFQQSFAAWPMRFFVLDGGRVVHKAQPDPETCTYHLDDLEAWLETNLACPP